MSGVRGKNCFGAQFVPRYIFRQAVELQHAGDYSTVQVAHQLGTSLSAAKRRHGPSREAVETARPFGFPITNSMVASLKLEIATPDGVVYSDDVDMVTLTGVEGQMGILPHRVRLMTKLVPGEMIIRKGGRGESLAVGEGLIEITGQRVSIVTDMAIAADKIDEVMVEEARQRAAARLREKLSSEEVASVHAALARSLAELYVKRRHPRR